MTTADGTLREPSPRSPVRRPASPKPAGHRPEEEAAPLGVGEKLDVEAGKRRKDVGVGIGDVIVDNEGRQKCRRRRKRR